ncbi:hypothetical protein Ndes2437A_g07618 [Nannochloris sp. 'desiccata']
MLRPSHGHLGVLCGAASIGIARASPSYAGIHPLMAMMSPRHVVVRKGAGTVGKTSSNFVSCLALEL